MPVPMFPGSSLTFSFDCETTPGSPLKFNLRTARTSHGPGCRPFEIEEQEVYINYFYFSSRIFSQFSAYQV